MDSANTLDSDHQLRVDLAVTHRVLAAYGWNEGIVNHLTALLPNQDEQFFALPYGLHWAEVKSSDFMVVDLDGNILAGEGEVEPTNLNIHGALHRSCMHARVVLHTHQPNITALTTLQDQSLLMISQHALRFAGRVAQLEVYGDPARLEVGRQIVRSLKKQDILLCANHGVIVCRPTVWDAFDDLYFLDRACELQLAALATGRQLRIIPDKQASELGKHILEWSKEEGRRHFEALRRLQLQKAPEISQ